MACCMEEERISWTAFSAPNADGNSVADSCDSVVNCEVDSESERWENFSFHKVEFANGHERQMQNNQNEIENVTSVDEEKTNLSKLSKELLPVVLKKCFPNRTLLCTLPQDTEEDTAEENYCSCDGNGHAHGSGLTCAAFQSRLWTDIHEDLGKVGPTKWKETSLYKLFKKRLDPSLSSKDKEEWEEAIENLELTDQGIYMDFHKLASGRFSDMFRFRKEKDNHSFYWISSTNNDDSSSDSTSLSDTISMNSYGDININAKEEESTEEQFKELRTNNKEDEKVEKESDSSSRCISPSEVAVRKKWKKIGVQNPMFDGYTAISGLARLSLSELKTLHNEIETTCTEYSQRLIQDLTRRDELIREKEIRDKFIALLLSVQRKQKENESLQSRRKIFSRSGSHEQKFLDTTIPYLPADDGPDLDSIRKLTEILQAILNEDPKVPDMVTNYILKIIRVMQYPQKIS